MIRNLRWTGPGTLKYGEADRLLLIILAFTVLLKVSSTYHLLHINHMSLTTLDKGKGRALPAGEEHIPLEEEENAGSSSSSSSSSSDSESDSDDSDASSSSDSDSDNSEDSEEVTQDVLNSLLEKARQSALASTSGASGVVPFDGEEDVIQLEKDETDAYVIFSS